MQDKAIESGQINVRNEPYRTAGGLLSMDPDKWQVCRFVIDDGGAEVGGWGVYPPKQALPFAFHEHHNDAINEASRLAMFAVVPPENVVAVEPLWDNPIEKEEDVIDD